MKYGMEEVRKELSLMKNFLDNEPYAYTGYQTNLRKAAVLVDFIIGRCTESIECDGNCDSEINVTKYAVTSMTKQNDKDLK